MSFGLQSPDWRLQVNSQSPTGQIIGLSSTTSVDFLIFPGPRPFFFGGSCCVISLSGSAFEPSPTSRTGCEVHFVLECFLRVALVRPDFLGAISVLEITKKYVLCMIWKNLCKNLLNK